jgi:hypothetical protein
VEQATQTDSLEMAELAVEQDRQLDAAHNKAGEKTRDLARALEQVQALQTQLQLQTQLADQYKEEVRTLEIQFEGAMGKQRRAEDALSLAECQLRKERGQQSTRPVSRAWDEPLVSCGGAKDAPSQASTRSSFNARCWSANGRRRGGGIRPPTGGRDTPETDIFTPRGACDEPAFEESLSTSEGEGEAELSPFRPRFS